MEWRDALEVGTVVLAGLGGGGTIVLGFSRFLGDVWLQRWKGEIDQRLQTMKGKIDEGLQRLDARLEHRNFVLQRFAELELEGLADCWRAARACVPLLNETRPINSGTDTEVLRRNTERLVDGHNKLIEVVGRHEVFLPPGIVRTLDRMSELLRLELSHIRHHPAFQDRWWEEGEQNQRHYADLVKDLLMQMKERATTLREEEEAGR